MEAIDFEIILPPFNKPAVAGVRLIFLQPDILGVFPSPEDLSIYF